MKSIFVVVKVRKKNIGDANFVPEDDFHLQFEGEICPVH